MYGFGLMVGFVAEAIVFQIAQTRPIPDVAISIGLVIGLIFIVVSFCGTRRFYQDRPGLIRALIVPIAAAVGTVGGLRAAYFAHKVKFYDHWSLATNYHSSAEGFNVFTFEPSARFNISALQVWPLPDEGTLCLAPIAFTPDTGKQRLETPEHTYRYWAVDFNCCASVPVTEPSQANSHSASSVPEPSHRVHERSRVSQTSYGQRSASSYSSEASFLELEVLTERSEQQITSQHEATKGVAPSSAQPKTTIEQAEAQIPAIVPATMTEEQRRTIAVVAVAAAHAAKGGVPEVVAVAASPAAPSAPSKTQGVTAPAESQSKDSTAKQPTPSTSPKPEDDSHTDAVPPVAVPPVVAPPVNATGESTLVAKLQVHLKAEQEKAALEEKMEKEQELKEKEIEAKSQPSTVESVPPSNDVTTAAQSSAPSTSSSASVDTVSSQLEATLATVGAKPHGASAEDTKDSSRSGKKGDGKSRKKGPLSASATLRNAETDRVKRVKAELREKSKKSIAEDAVNAAAAAASASESTSGTSDGSPALAHTTTASHAKPAGSASATTPDKANAVTSAATVPSVPLLLSEDKVSKVIQTDIVKLEPVIDSASVEAATNTSAATAVKSKLAKIKSPAASNAPAHSNSEVKKEVIAKLREKEKQKRRHKRKEKRVLIKLPPSGDVSAAEITVAPATVPPTMIVANTTAPAVAQSTQTSSPSALTAPPKGPTPVASVSNSPTPAAAAVVPASSSTVQAQPTASQLAPAAGSTPVPAPAPAPASSTPATLIAAAPTSSPLPSVRLVSVATCPAIVATGVARDAIRLKPDQVWGDALSALRKLDPYVKIPPDAVFLKVSSAGTAKADRKAAIHAKFMALLTIPFCWPILGIFTWLMWSCVVSCYADQIGANLRGKKGFSFFNDFSEQVSAFAMGSFRMKSGESMSSGLLSKSYTLSGDGESNSTDIAMLQKELTPNQETVISDSSELQNELEDDAEELEDVVYTPDSDDNDDIDSDYLEEDDNEEDDLEEAEGGVDN